MGTRTRDSIFLGLAIAFLVTSIVMVTRQPSPRMRVVAPPAAAPTPVVPPEVPVLAPPVRVVQGLPEAPKRNPFAAPAAAARLKGALAPPPAPAASTPTPAPVTPIPVPAVAAAPPTGLPPLAAPQVSAPKAPPAPVLLGVMNGSTRNPTAVIRDGTRPYYAKQGDKIGGQYTVESVSSSMVVLVSGQSKLILKMGGS